MRYIIAAHAYRRAFSLVEALTASVVVTVSGAAMLLAIGQSLQASSAGIDNTRTSMLADELMAEISACRWTDADNPGHWGPEDGEIWKLARLRFDDLDDYDGWYGPPQTKSGTQYDAWQKSYFKSVPSHPYANYVCRVYVQQVTADGKPLMAGESSAYRRVTVEIARERQPPHRLTQTFIDIAPLLGRNHWYSAEPTEEFASVEIVP